MKGKQETGKAHSTLTKEKNASVENDSVEERASKMDFSFWLILFVAAMCILLQICAQTQREEAAVRALEEAEKGQAEEEAPAFPPRYV